MTSIYETAIREVHTGLSTLIAAYHARYASEFQFPSTDADRSENDMAANKVKVLALRKMREEFENIITGVKL